MTTAQIKTASWFTKLTDEHQRIGISRGTPRGQAAGYRIYKALAPGSWFNSVDPQTYCDRYRAEILSRLDPQAVMADLANMAASKIPVLLCFERPGAGSWCHRAMAAEWLASGLGIEVPEYGYEHLAQPDHPLMPPE